MLPKQCLGRLSKRLEAFEKRCRAVMELVGAVLECLGSTLAWSHLGAILGRLGACILDSAVAKGGFSEICQSSLLKDIFNGITIHRDPSQIPLKEASLTGLRRVKNSQFVSKYCVGSL